jgi:hypothetical protein
VISRTKESPADEISLRYSAKKAIRAVLAEVADEEAIRKTMYSAKKPKTTNSQPKWSRSLQFQSQSCGESLANEKNLDSAFIFLLARPLRPLLVSGGGLDDPRSSVNFTLSVRTLHDLPQHLLATRRALGSLDHFLVGRPFGPLNRLFVPVRPFGSLDGFLVSARGAFGSLGGGHRFAVFFSFFYLLDPEKKIIFSPLFYFFKTLGNPP